MMSNSILTPGYVRWDGLKFVFDPNVTVIDSQGPAGATGPAGPQGPEGPSGSGGGGSNGQSSRALDYKNFKFNPESNNGSATSTTWFSGTFNTLDHIQDADSGFSATQLSGRDLVIMGDFLYVAGNFAIDTADGVAAIFQININNVNEIHIFNVPSADMPYSISGFRDFDFDKLLVITPTTVSLFNYGRVTGAITTPFSYTGSFDNSRGVILTGNPDSSDGALIWICPSSNTILAADPYGGDVSPITAFTADPSADGTPTAICIDTETHDIWVSFTGGLTDNIQKFSIDFDTKILTQIYRVNNITSQEMCFDGSSLWAWNQTSDPTFGGTIYRFTTGGTQLSAYKLSTVSFTNNPKGRMIFDGKFMLLSLENGAIAKMHPGTGEPCGEMFSGGYNYRGITVSEKEDVFAAVYNTDLTVLEIKKFSPYKNKYQDGNSILTLLHNESFNFIDSTTLDNHAIFQWDIIGLGDPNGSGSNSTVLLPVTSKTFPAMNQKITVKDIFGFASIHPISILSQLSGNALFVDGYFNGTDQTDGIIIAGLNGFDDSFVGEQITITGAANANNNGSYPITSVLSDNTIVIDNETGADTDANNGSISWKVGSFTIDGSSSYTINKNFGAVTIIWSGTNWFVINAYNS